MNHPLPIRHDHGSVTPLPEAPGAQLPQPALDNDMGPAVQWLYEQWLAKDVAAPHRQR